LPYRNIKNEDERRKLSKYNNNNKDNNIDSDDDCSLKIPNRIFMFSFHGRKKKGKSNFLRMMNHVLSLTAWLNWTQWENSISFWFSTKNLLKSKISKNSYNFLPPKCVLVQLYSTLFFSLAPFSQKTVKT